MLGVVSQLLTEGRKLVFLPLVAIPAEAKAAVKGCGAQRSNRRRRPKALGGGPSGGYPAKKRPAYWSASPLWFGAGFPPY